MIGLGSKWLRTTICGALAGVLLGSCADTETSLFIQGNLLREPPDCTVTPDPSATFLGGGLLDVGLNRTWMASLLVGNQQTSRGAKAQLRPETRRVGLQGAEVTLTDLAGNVIESAFSVPGAGFADVSTSESPGYGVIFVDVIPESVGNRLASQLRNAGRGSSRKVIAEIRVFGVAIGGQEIESAPFIYPIDVCYGCSVIFPPEALQNVNGEVVCAAGLEGVAVEMCLPPQDSYVDCRFCAINHPDVCYSAPI